MDKCIICNTRKWFGKYENGKCNDCIWAEDIRKIYKRDSADITSRKHEYRTDNDYICNITNTSLLFDTSNIASDSHCHSNHDHSSYSSHSSHDTYTSYDSSSYDSSSDCSCDCGGCD